MPGHVNHHIPENQHVAYYLCSSYRARNPDLFRSCGHETPFSDQKGASKIGDSVLWPHMLLSFVIILSCKDVTKDHSIPEKPTHRIRCCYQPRVPIARFDIQTAFRARMNIFKSGISVSGFYYIL
jgi:hypothetical protein